MRRRRRRVRVSAKRQKSPIVLSPQEVKLGLAELEFRDQILVFLDGALGSICKRLQFRLQVLVNNKDMVARERLEPPPPTFSGPLSASGPNGARAPMRWRERRDSNPRPPA